MEPMIDEQAGYGGYGGLLVAEYYRRKKTEETFNSLRK
jgi:hypothetical protein